MKKTLILIVSILLLISCWKTMTLEERKEYTKQLEIKRDISKQKTKAIQDEMWKYYLWCRNICVPWWTPTSSMRCITNCINSLKKEKIFIQ